jgi:hypothetical protein
MSYQPVMPGLVPGIHVFQQCSKQDVDGRVKPGHDDVLMNRCLATRTQD